MYRGYDFFACGVSGVTRNSSLYLQEEEARSLLERCVRSCTIAAKVTSPPEIAS